MNTFPKLFLHFIHLLIFSFFFSCSNKLSPEPSTQWSIKGTSLITGTPLANIGDYKTISVSVPVITESMSSNYITKRNGTFPYPIITISGGTLIQNVDPKIIKLLCFDNPKYNTTTQNLNGWLNLSVVHVSSNGATRNVNGELNPQSAISLSFTITFFTDGVYTIINGVDETLNQIGNYQPVIEKEILTGIIYKPFKVGKNFGTNFDSNLENYSQNPLGFGVWGIDENSFYPLQSIDASNSVFLKMRKHTY